MKDLQHLYYFEKLLEEVNNDLVREAQNKGSIAIGAVCFQIPEPLINLPGCFSVRLRAPRTGSIEMGTYYMSSMLCEGCRAILERAIEGGFEFLDCIIAPDACAQMNRCVENIERQNLCSKEKFFVEYSDVPMKDDETALRHYVRQMRAHVLEPLNKVYGIDISDEALRKSVDLQNKISRLITQIGDYRKEDNPRITGYEFAVLCLATYCCPKEALIEKLADKFWPGPLTMILKKSDIVPDSITGGLGTVAIRMPSHKVAAELIRTSGVYIAAPSANTSGKPSPTRASHVIKDLSGKIDMIIEDDTVDIGVESTIIDLSEEVPTILRPGYITKEMFEEVIGVVRIDPAITEGVKSGVVPKAPGMKYKHYAPDADLKIVEGDEAKVVEYINDNVNRLISQGYKVAVMTTEEGKHNYNKGIIVSMGHKDDELSAARHLYAVLREFDNENVDYVFSESFETDNVGRAVMNRLIKAAGHTIINV